MRPQPQLTKINAKAASKVALAALLAAGAIFSTTHASAQLRDFRSINPIATPAVPALRLSSPRAVPREVVEKAVRDIAGAWNSGRLEGYLDRDFANGLRLEDVFRFTLPRDAKLVVLSIRSVSVLDQQLSREPVTPHQAPSVVSLVNAVVETQIEFLDGRAGFVRLPGSNEFTLRITEAF